MNGYNMKRRSQTDWARVDALTDNEIDLSEVPELDESFFANAILRMPCSPMVVATREQLEHGAREANPLILNIERDGIRL